jgi:signal transduction histidine kinase
MVRERFQRIANGGSNPPTEMRWRCLDGSIAEMESVAGAIPWEGKPAVQVVVRDITERKRADAEREHLLQTAESARAEAEAANRAKSDFLAAMSHEIRTPLNGVLGYVDLLELGIGGPLTDTQRAHLARIKTSGGHLLRVINDILDLAKVESGKIDLGHERALAVNAIAAALTFISPQAAQRGIEVHESCAGDTATYYVGDEDRVRQILVNLLSDAVKFTRPGGQITVTCGYEPGAEPSGSKGEEEYAYIRVSDTGIGIPAEQLERVFQPFVQAESGYTRTEGGTGLGLSISRQLARLMGGDLTAESEPGKGSSFTLWLPKSTPAEDILPVIQQPNEGLRGLAKSAKRCRRRHPSCSFPICSASAATRACRGLPHWGRETCKTTSPPFWRTSHRRSSRWREATPTVPHSCGTGQRSSASSPSSTESNGHDSVGRKRRSRVISKCCGKRSRTCCAGKLRHWIGKATLPGSCSPGCCNTPNRSVTGASSAR